MGIAAQYRGEPAHHGVAPEGAELADPPVLVWTAGPFAIGTYDASKSSPAVDEETVYVGQDDGLLRAIDRQTGQLRWSFATRRHAEELGCSEAACTGIHGSAAFDDQRIYVGDYAGWLYAIERATGVLAWERELGGSIGSSPVIDGQKLWIAVEDPEPNGRVFLLDRMTGKVEAVSPYLGHHIHGTASLLPQHGFLITGTNAGQLYGLSPTTLEVVWGLGFGSAIKATAAVDGERAYITAWDGAMHAVDITTGSQVFSVPTSKPSLSSPAIFEEIVCFGSHDTKLRCVDQATGTLRWTASTGGYIQSSPTIVARSRLVLVGSSDGGLYAFGLDHGALVFQFDLGAAITSVPVVVDRSIFVNDDRGRVSRLDSPPSR